MPRPGSRRSRSRRCSRSSCSLSHSSSRSRSRSRSKSPKRRRHRSKPRSGSRRSKSSVDGRKPHPDVMKRSDEETIRKRIFIANVRSDVVVPDDLIAIFKAHGNVLGVNITPGGYAFVQFETEEEAMKAKAAENGNLLKGRKMAVQMASENRKNPMRDRSPVREGRGRGGPASRGGRAAPHPGHQPPYHSAGPGFGRSSAPYHAPPYDPYPPRHSPYPPGRDPYPPIDDLPPRSSMRDYLIEERELARRDFLRRDPYFDDAYRRLPPDPYYDRLVSDRLADSYRDRLPPPKSSSPVKHPMECQIIIMSPVLRTYGEAVEKRVKHIGIFTEILILPPERTLQEAIDDVTSQSFLFAIVISQQNEAHRSLTLNILHGKPQVHRNMPLEDCITLMEKSFEKYLTKKKEKELSDKGADFVRPDASTSYILHLIADNRSVSADELDKAIEYLTERRARNREPAPGSSDSAHEPQREEPSVVQQRQELQERINKLFPSANTSQQPKTSVTSLVNFDNPNVQKALDDLIQNPGPLQNRGGMHEARPLGNIAGSVGAAGNMRDMGAMMMNNGDPAKTTNAAAAQRAAQAQMFAATEHTQLARPPISMRFHRPY